MLDEVITGYGRTGEWFAAQAMGVSHDHHHCQGVTSGCQPLSALLVGDRISSMFEKGGEFYRLHLFGASGCPRRGAGQPRIIEKRADRASGTNRPYFNQARRLWPWHRRRGALVRLMGAIEIVKDKDARAPRMRQRSCCRRDHAIANGMLCARPATP